MADDKLSEHIKDEESRLDRIEMKIDKLSEAMIDLARAEEKLFHVEKTHQQHFERMNRFSERMDRVEKKVDDNARTVDIIKFVVAAIFIAAVGTISSTFV